MSTYSHEPPYNEHFKLHLGVPEQPEWRRASDIVSSETWLVAHLTAMHERLAYMPRHILATNFYDHYEWYLAVAAQESRAMVAALPYPTQPRYFEVECNGEREIFLDGSVCCYWYKRPDNETGAFCGNCPKVPLPQRIEILRRHIQKLN